MFSRTRFLFLILLLEAALLTALWSGRFLEKAGFAPSVRSERATRGLFEGPFQIVEKFSFDSQTSLKGWEEKIFKGQTLYKVLREGGHGFLSSVSQDAASGLYIRMTQPMLPGLVLRWRWRAREFPRKKNPEILANRSEDDFAARLYVIFPGANFFKTNVIEYVWDERWPAGTVVPSAFSDRIQLVVERSGPAKAGEDGWQEEQRNLWDDYAAFFGRQPDRPIGAIGIMCDSDNTGTRSSADFGEIALMKQKIQPVPSSKKETQP